MFMPSNSMENHTNSQFMTFGIKAVDPWKLTDDNFRKRMGNFDRICKQIDEKHDHVMEMLANIQEQLQVLEMNRRKGSRVDFGVANSQSQIQFSSLDQSPKPAPKGENEGISNIEVVTGPATISKSSNDTKLENEECVELLKYVPSIATVTMEAYYSTTKATEIQEQRVFDEMLESEKSKISDILPPFIPGSEFAEVYDFDVSNPQFQMPLVNTREIKMELECLSLIPSPSSFGFSLDDTKLEDEGLVDVPIHTSVAESQLQESKSEFERLENFLDLSLPKFIPSWRIMVSSLLHLPFLYKCYGVEALTKEELIWLDTGQYLMVSGLSREGVTSNFTGSWNLMNAMYRDRNRLVSETQLKGLELDLSTIEAENHSVEMKTFVIKPNIIIYSTLLLVLCGVGKMYEARILLIEMVDKYIAPTNISTFMKLICGQRRTRELDIVVDVLKVIIKLSITMEVGKYRILVGNRGKDGQYDRVVNLLVKLIEEDIIMNPQSALNMEHSSYNPIIDYLGNNDQEKTETPVRQLRKLCMQDPTAITLPFEIESLHHDFRLAEQNKKRTVMALQSGLKSELAWALNALTFISFKEEDEVPKDAPSLAMNLGLLDALLKAIGDWLNIALLIVLAKTPRVRLLGANAVVTGFGSEYESIIIGDSVSYHIVGSSGYSNDNPCSQKNIAKPCSSVWWFEGDGLLNLDEEGRAGKQQCAGAVSNIIRSFSFMVEIKTAMGHNRHCLETMFHCLQDYVTKDEEQLVTNFEFGLFEQEVVENDCQIFEANFQVKAATKYALEPDLTKENRRISSSLELEDDFLVATVFEAYGCKDKLFDRPPLKPPFQCRHLIESWGQDSFKRGVLS